MTPMLERKTLRSIQKDQKSANMVVKYLQIQRYTCKVSRKAREWTRGYLPRKTSLLKGDTSNPDLSLSVSSIEVKRSNSYSLHLLDKTDEKYGCMDGCGDFLFFENIAITLADNYRYSKRPKCPARVK